MEKKNNILIALALIVILALASVSLYLYSRLQQHEKLINNHGQYLFLLLSDPKINAAVSAQVKAIRGDVDNASTTPKK